MITWLGKPQIFARPIMCPGSALNYMRLPPISQMENHPAQLSIVSRRRHAWLWLAVALTWFSPLTGSSSKPISPLEERGKSIYLDGADSKAVEIKSQLGDVEMSGKVQACVNCHGATGKGVSEGGVSVGDISWDYLTLPYGHTDPDGRRHPPFTKESFYRAVTRGLDPANHRLPVAMPRFQLSRRQTDELVNYLKFISSDYDPGLSATTIHIACLLPADDPDAGYAMRSLLEAYFNRLNQAGGVYSRHVELHFLELAEGSHGTDQIRSLINRREVLAILLPGELVEKEASQLAEGSRIPLLASADLSAGESVHADYVFSFVVGPAVEAAQLIKFGVSEKGVTSGHAAVVFSDVRWAARLQEPIERAWRELALPPAPIYSVSNGAAPSLSLTLQLQKQGIESVFFFGSSRDAMAFLQAAHQANWAPTLFLVGSVSGLSVGEVPSEFDRRIFLCYSASEEGPDSRASAEFREFLKSHQLSERFWSAQVFAFVGASVLEEALKRAGKDLSREKLVQSLEGLHGFETGVLPPVSFGPGRHVGIATIRIFEVDLEKNGLELVRVATAQ